MPSEAHEQLVQLILENPTPADASMADRRAAFDELLLSMPLPPDLETSTVSVDGVSVRWVSVQGAREDHVVLLTHGGGGCMGTAETYQEFASRISRAARARVAVVDYRLAPEAPFPAGLDDCCAAYRWLLEQGVSARSIIVAGDSGGAGLALAVVARARDEGLDMPAAVVGFAPWIDLSIGETIANASDVGDPMLTRDDLGFFAEQYLQGHSPTDPVANLLQGDVRRMSPLLLLAATRDIGYCDSLRLAQLAREANVPVKVQTFHGLIHNWQVFSQLPEAADAMTALAEFVDERLPDEVLLSKET